MIRIKNLKDNYAIDYENEGSQEFVLKNGEQSIKHSKTQKELEDYLDRILKANNKFKTPIKAFTFNTGFGSTEIITHGIITSSNFEDNSFWFVNDKGTRTKINFRDTDYNGRPSNCGYYQETAKNLETLAEIIRLDNEAKTLKQQVENLKKSLEVPLTKEFVRTYKEDK